MQDKLPNLKYKGKRYALNMLNIIVFIDGEKMEITGTINPEVVVTENIPPR